MARKKLRVSKSAVEALTSKSQGKCQADLQGRAEHYAAIVRERMADQQYENTIRKELLNDMVEMGQTKINLPDGKCLKVVTTTTTKLKIVDK